MIFAIDTVSSRIAPAPTASDGRGVQRIDGAIPSTRADIAGLAWRVLAYRQMPVGERTLLEGAHLLLPPAGISRAVIRRMHRPSVGQAPGESEWAQGEDRRDTASRIPADACSTV